MSDFLDAIWSLFTNNGMYSDTETVLMIIFSFILTFVYFWYIFHKSAARLKSDMISDLGEEGYLELKESMKKT